MSGYVYLAIAICAEVVATTSMKALAASVARCHCCWW